MRKRKIKSNDANDANDVNDAKIILSINYVNYHDGEKKAYQDFALSVLEKNKPSNVEVAVFAHEDDDVKVPASFRVFKTLKRNSKKIIGNNRPLPYIKDILSQCFKMECDIFGYINSDILITKNFFDCFDKKKIDAYMFMRYDISQVKDIGEFNKKSFKIKYKNHPGFDSFFFRKKWWELNKQRFHDNLILGEPEWDFYYYQRIYEGTREILIQRDLYHVFHRTIWTLESPGAINNRRINKSIT